MLHIDATFEDNRVIITRDSTITRLNDDRPLPATANKWNGVIVDAMTGTTATVCWTDKQTSAILALANGLGEDLYETDKNDPMIKVLYDIAEPCFADIPKECRLIP